MNVSDLLLRILGSHGVRQIYGVLVDRPRDIAPAIDHALAANKAKVIDVRVDPDALILPLETKLGQAFSFSLAKLKELFE